MARTETYQDPTTLDALAIEQVIADGANPVVQFSKPAPEAVLREVNSLCERFGEALEVRFYDFQFKAFDGRALRLLPAAATLSVDCLADMSHVEELGGLARLTRLSLQVERLADTSLLALPNLRRLKRLSVAAAKSGTVDLAPVAAMSELQELTVGGQETSIESVGACERLERLRLLSIGRRIKLGFVARLPRLRFLELLLGGRDDLDELRHPSLIELEIERVRGFARLVPASFPGLEHLKVGHLPQLEGVDFGVTNPRLSSLRAVSCEKLKRLAGLEHLRSLDEVRLVRTGIDLDALLAQPLPKGLRAFAFYTGKERADVAIRKRLDALGYAED